MRHQTQEHKNKIGQANKGRNLNMASGVLVLRDGKKLCLTCQTWKPVTAFHKRPERPIGLRSKCKGCEMAARQQNQEADKLIQYKSGAKRRGISFDLSKEEFLTFWQLPCYYCGDAIETIGLDRVDSGKGYSVANVVPCCATCNTMKLALPHDVFVHHCQKVIKHQTRY